VIAEPIALPASTLLDALEADQPVDAPAAAGAAAPAAAAARGHGVVLFTVADSTYGVRETFVSEVARVPSMTAVPRVPAWLRGVTNLRGDIVSVADLRVFLGLEPTSLHTGRLLVVRLPSEDFAIGLLVDRVDLIASVPADAVRPPASAIEGALAPFFTGVCQVGDRLITVIDLDRFLRSPEIRQFERQLTT
jgi:purine-binding chemotaxis protein CheW